MKIALVTGASSGMGLEFARQLAAKDYALAIVSNQQEQLKDAAESLRKEFGVPVESLCIDLAGHGVAEEVLQWCPEPDILINNAGIFFMEYLGPGNLGKVRTMMALHMETVTELCILAGTQMKEKGAGHILNMSSMTARIPAPGIAIYSSTKAYLKSFGKSFSYEMRPFGVTVTTVCPAAVDTGLYPLDDRLRKTLRRIGLIRTPEWLVRKALRAMFRGRRTFSPGLTNAILPPLIALLPARLIDHLGLKWIAGKS
jgi:short-subunit dehydrogenase